MDSCGLVPLSHRVNDPTILTQSPQHFHKIKPSRDTRGVHIGRHQTYCVRRAITELTATRRKEKGTGGESIEGNYIS